MRRVYLTLTILLAIIFGANAQRAKSVILVYLDGGPAQTDTFDPKPEAGRTYTGSYTKVAAGKTAKKRMKGLVEEKHQTQDDALMLPWALEI